MNIFDKYIAQILDSVSQESLTTIDTSAGAWEISEKNPFLMERDTALELGGYPKESINVVVPSSELRGLLGGSLSDGVYAVGNPEVFKGKDEHVSFGKIVLLKTDGIPDSEWYAFTQAELMTDSRIRLKDVMLRQSPTHYNINYRVGKKAIKDGISAGKIGKSIYDAYKSMDHVKSVVVILIFGESDLYKKLLEPAERIKEVTLTLNHIFDGIDMDCGRCDLVEICNEVEGMRDLHKKRIGDGSRSLF